MKILLGTNNQHKIIEMSRIIKECAKDKQIEIITLRDLKRIDEPKEDGLTFIENATIKAKYFYDAYQIPVIADDSGLEVDILDGMPGIFSARFASCDGYNSTDKANRDKLLTLLKDKPSKEAHFTCGIVFYDGNNLITAEGKTNGKILEQETGTNGFGYDPIFYSYALGMPFGLATSEQKDMISHRGIALNSLLSKMKI